VVAHEAGPKPSTFQERMTIMDCHSSATARSEAPHATETISNKIISDALKRRAQSVINDRSIDPESRALVRYALEINDPCLAQLVRLADAGESIVAALERSEISETIEEDWSEERIETLAKIICRTGDEPDTKSAALFVLMGRLNIQTIPNYLRTQPSILPSVAAESSTCTAWLTLSLRSLKGSC
jgi:hypothetical protein